MHPENDRFGDSVVADQDRFTSSRGDGWNASLISAYLSHKPSIFTRASDKRTKLPRNATDRVTMDDDDLITAVTSGDDIALRTLFERHAPWLAARLRRTLPVDAVEDVLQETFLAVWRSAGGYADRGDVGAWIWGIARRQAALNHRKQGHAASEAIWDDQIGETDSEDLAVGVVNRTDLASAIATLGPDEGPTQELVRLFFIEDRPLADVAAKLGIPVGTVKSRIYAVRRQLRLVLAEIH
jgi:RNA polymerase sigma-70 factor (ECF subfamily)